METSGPIADSSNDSPTVYILAGPNGAGKTTFATRFLPDTVRCREFLNADLIAKGLSPFAPETQNFRAARLLLERVRELASQRADFGIETTLSGRTYVKLLKDLRTDGYRVELFFLWIPDVQMTIDRVAGRVEQGGHGIPLVDIQRRYFAGLENLVTMYLPILDEWSLYDSSCFPPNLILFQVGEFRDIYDDRLFQQFSESAGLDYGQKE